MDIKLSQEFFLSLNMKIKLVILLLIITTPVLARTFKAEVTRVIDGATIGVKTEDGKEIEIHIWGIDVPEKFKTHKLFWQSRHCEKPYWVIQKLGEKVAEKAEELLDHEEVFIRTKGYDYYGRLLGILYLENGTDYGFEMIKEGYACAYWKNYSEEYREAQKEAEKKLKGLWAIDYRFMKCLCQ